MALYKDAEQLAAHLNDKGFDCSVDDDQGVVLELPGIGQFASIKLSAGWLVLKLFVVELGIRDPQAAMQSLLRLNDRLIGFRFALDNQDVCVLQDFPLDILNDRIEIYLEHLSTVLEAVLPGLREYLCEGVTMTDEDIDALFDRLDGSTH